MPELYGVSSSYPRIHDWHFEEGAAFDDGDAAASTTNCVLGSAAKVSLFGYTPAMGKYLKVNDTWLHVIGVLQPITSSGNGAESTDPNELIYVPFSTFRYRFYDMGGYLKDDLQGVDIRLKEGTDSAGAARVVTAILDSTHHSTPDFSVTIPAELLAEQQRSQTIFTYVMVAIAAISLLVGGIGIMNIVLATVLERTREIGIRRATGARRSDIVRQFLLESMLISMGGGVAGIAFGYLLSWVIAKTADWKTIVTFTSIGIAFGVSMAVGVVFGIYPAQQAARIDPIEALRYE
jgi:putative ABC transport system permease protein